MAREKYILVSHFCKHTNIENDFVQHLHEYGLVKIEERENDAFIEEKNISKIERMFRLHHDLGINFEGLDVISEMLKRIRSMEKDLANVQKRLSLYE